MYTFEKDNLVICKPDGKIAKTSKDHWIYARVISVDRIANEVYLDKYLKEGCLHSSAPSKLPLSELESGNYYQLMNDDEVLRFRDNLAKLVASPYQANRLDNVDVSATFVVANERAEVIVREREKNGQKSSKRNDIERD